MKRYIFLVLILFLIIPSYSNAEKFLEAPLIPGGNTINKTDDRFEFKVGLSHSDAVKFYRDALQGWKDIKFRDWKDSTYIEDDGNRPWHSINVFKDDVKETRILITRDNWTWIIGTLTIRFTGVFVVLMVLFLGMSIAGKIISSSVKKFEREKTA